MIRIKIILLFICSCSFLNISGSVKIQNSDALYNCSSVLCSYDKLSNIHENSKAILTELENILFDVRGEKNVHQSGLFKKKLIKTILENTKLFF